MPEAEQPSIMGELTQTTSTCKMSKSMWRTRQEEEVNQRAEQGVSLEVSQEPDGRQSFRQQGSGRSKICSENGPGSQGSRYWNVEKETSKVREYQDLENKIMIFKIFSASITRQPKGGKRQAMARVRPTSLTMWPTWRKERNIKWKSMKISGSWLGGAIVRIQDKIWVK